MPEFTVDVTHSRVLRFTVEAASADEACALVQGYEGRVDRQPHQVVEQHLHDAEVVRPPAPPQACLYPDRHLPNHAPDRRFPVLLLLPTGDDRCHLVGTEAEISRFATGSGPAHIMCGSEFDWWHEYHEPPRAGRFTMQEYQAMMTPLDAERVSCTVHPCEHAFEDECDDCPWPAAAELA